MCEYCDYLRTVALLMDLTVYADTPGADEEFADTVGYALAASLPTEEA